MLPHVERVFFFLKTFAFQILARPFSSNPYRNSSSSSSFASFSFLLFLPLLRLPLSLTLPRLLDPSVLYSTSSILTLLPSSSLLHLILHLPPPPPLLLHLHFSPPFPPVLKAVTPELQKRMAEIQRGNNTTFRPAAVSFHSKQRNYVLTKIGKLKSKKTIFKKPEKIEKFQ
jgi:hypothetical protein